MSKNQEDMTIKQSLEVLSEKIDWFSGEDFNIDQAVDKYQEAVEFANDVIARLEDVQNKIDIIRG